MSSTHVECSKCGGESSYCHNRYEDDHGIWRERWRIECFGNDHKGCGARGEWCDSLGRAVAAWNRICNKCRGIFDTDDDE